MINKSIREKFKDMEKNNKEELEFLKENSINKNNIAKTYVYDFSGKNYLKDLSEITGGLLGDNEDSYSLKYEGDVTDLNNYVKVMVRENGFLNKLKRKSSLLFSYSFSSISFDNEYLCGNKYKNTVPKNIMLVTSDVLSDDIFRQLGFVKYKEYIENNIKGDYFREKLLYNKEEDYEIPLVYLLEEERLELNNDNLVSGYNINIDSTENTHKYYLENNLIELYSLVSFLPMVRLFSKDFVFTYNISISKNKILTLISGYRKDTNQLIEKVIYDYDISEGKYNYEDYYKGLKDELISRGSEYSIIDGLSIILHDYFDVITMSI